MFGRPLVTAALIGFTTLAFALPIDFGISPWVLVALRVAWLLPNWVLMWLDVRDRWRRP